MNSPLQRCSSLGRAWMLPDLLPYRRDSRRRRRPAGYCGVPGGAASRYMNLRRFGAERGNG